jgi:PKHD-type hydroxylase
MSAIAIRRVLSDEQLQAIRSTIAGGPFVDGAQTAVGGAATGKHNLQLAPTSDASTKAGELLVAGCRESSTFLAATWVEAMMAPMFCRYEPGMTYGNHIDGAFMGEAPDQLRCDIAVTICLVDGTTYDGGELVIDAAGVPRRWKGDAGDCIIYPADTLHRVEPVTKGIREVAVLWIQSMVRDPAQRRILFDVKEALDDLDRAQGPPAPVEALRRVYFNLIRMWA